jgi:hypothetical protein
LLPVAQSGVENDDLVRFRAHGNRFFFTPKRVKVKVCVLAFIGLAYFRVWTLLLPSSSPGHAMIAKVKSSEGLVPKIVTPPPGPKARKVLEREKNFVSGSHTKGYPFVADHGEGCFVWDIDGNCFLDFASGIAVNLLGHNHPRINEAVNAQMQKLVHYSAADFYYEPYGLLCEQLARLTPCDSPKKVFLSNSGTEAVECAI